MLKKLNAMKARKFNTKDQMEDIAMQVRLVSASGLDQINSLSRISQRMEAMRAQHMETNNRLLETEKIMRRGTDASRASSFVKGADPIARTMGGGKLNSPPSAASSSSTATKTPFVDPNKATVVGRTDTEAGWDVNTALPAGVAAEDMTYRQKFGTMRVPIPDNTPVPANGWRQAPRDLTKIADTLPFSDAKIRVRRGWQRTGNASLMPAMNDQRSWEKLGRVDTMTREDGVRRGSPHAPPGAVINKAGLYDLPIDVE